jgi:hypothetical protein
MMLTTAQLQTLKADILADPVLAAHPQNSDGAFAIAAAYNLPASPTWTVWRNGIPTKEIKRAVVWTEYIARSAGERDAFVLMTSNGVVDAGDANIRQGFLDIFSGPSGATTRAQLTTLSKRTATRAEKLFSTGTGSDASPATLTFEGTLSYQDVEAARTLA